LPEFLKSTTSYWPEERGLLSAQAVSERKSGGLIVVKATSLKHLDQRSVAIRLQIGSTNKVVCGLASYERKPRGSLLRIVSGPEAGNAEFLFDEASWDGVVALGREYGCDYLIELASAKAPIATSAC
jgi:hypothetical protein